MPPHARGSRQLQPHGRGNTGFPLRRGRGNTKCLLRAERGNTECLLRAEGGKTDCLFRRGRGGRRLSRLGQRLVVQLQGALGRAR